MTVYTQTFVLCPWCGGESGGRVDHLFHAPRPARFGDWTCEVCLKAFEGTILSDGTVAVRKSERHGTRTRCMVLLKIETTDGPVHFIMDHRRYESDGEKDSEAEAARSLEYFFEEHSCVSNWIGECTEVFGKGGQDPHGVLEFVRHVDVDSDFDADDADWQMIFPELAGGAQIEGEASEVSATAIALLRNPAPE